MDFQRLLDLILVNFLLVCANIILTFEITSLLNGLALPWLFLGIQALWAAASFIVFRLIKSPPVHSHGELIKGSLQGLAEFFRRNKGFAAFFVVVLIAYLCLAALSIYFPQNTSDSLYNHLSRIGHWLQQGSLKPYESFTIYGIIYPYNNSLLMMWFILFTHSDRLVGLIQWIAALILSHSIYGISTELKFTKKQAAFSALIFLTFPIIIFESMTAQNDILAATFFLSAVYLFIHGYEQSSNLCILFSAVSIALAIGTKQYVLFAAPGFLLLYFYFLTRKEFANRKKMAVNFILYIFIFTILLGSYNYIQNMIIYGNPIGSDDLIIDSRTDLSGSFGKKLSFNSTRLFSQFISCEGLPLPVEEKCLSIKGNLFRRLFSNPGFNLESGQFMLEEDCGSTCFSFSTRYPYNEESAWYGFISWILLIPGILIGIVFSIRQKKLIPPILIFTSIVYFLSISVFKTGWDAYVGRYLILSVALLVPFTGYLLADRAWWQKTFTTLIILMSVFVLVYAVVGNDSKPLLTKQKMVQVQLWGKSHNLLVTKAAYKLTPWFKEQISYLDFDREQLRVFTTGETDKVYPPTYLINQHIPEDSSVGVVANPGIVYDYLFFGEHLTRAVYDIPYQNDDTAVIGKIQKDNPQYILVYPEINLPLPANYHLLDRYDNYLLYQHES